jgi:hypothetical protein
MEVIAAAAGDLPRPTIAEAIQIQKLYRARDGPNGAPLPEPPPRSDEKELAEAILTKLDMLERRRSAKRLAEGWIRDPEGNWIPPGWVRKD